MTKDIWEYFYDTHIETNGDIGNYEDDGSAPPVFDEFIESL